MELYKRAIELREARLGPNSPKLIRLLHLYADALRKMQNYASAEKAEVRALGIEVRSALHGRS